METLCAYNTVLFDRGFTGHEHLYDFGLINMNGRMYDPLLSSFLSPDNYMQDPTSQQGFNRYAYCMYNPLKYVDPSGEQYYGWDPSLAYRMEQEAKAIVRNAWQQCYDSGMASHHLTIAMANCLYGHGEDTQGNGSGNHGSGGGGKRKASTKFNRYQQRQDGGLTYGICVITSLGSIIGGDSTDDWAKRADAYRTAFEKEPFDPNNLEEFISWNPDPEKYHTYECDEIYFSEIYDSMNNGYVVSFMCNFTQEMADEFGLTYKGHFVNVEALSIKDDKWIKIWFNDHPMNNYMQKYKSSNINRFMESDYKRYMYNIQQCKPILQYPRILRIKLMP